MKKKLSYYNIYAICLAFFGCFTLVIVQIYSNISPAHFTQFDEASYYLKLTAVIIITIAVIIALYSYLQDPNQVSFGNDIFSTRMSNPENTKNKTHKQSKITPNSLSIAKQLNTAQSRAAHTNDLNFDLLLLKERIDKEISALGKRANINLIVGSVISLMAIILLYPAVNKDLNVTTFTNVFAHYIPRISLVILMEAFAFFFLKIYKSALADIKYYHNEKTNIELKIVAVKAASLLKAETTSEQIILELSRTERNLILKQGETTIELEREKIDAANNKDMMGAMKDILSKLSEFKFTGTQSAS